MKKPVMTAVLGDEPYSFEVGLHKVIGTSREASVGLLASILAVFYDATPLTVEDFHWLADHFQSTERISERNEKAPTLFQAEELN